MYQSGVRTIVDQLREAAATEGITESELAARTGIERTKINKSFNGHRPLRTGAGDAEPEKIAEALGGTIEYIPPGHRVVAA